MVVRVEVINRPLDLRGPIYPVGERLGLDTDNPLHAQVLRRRGEWVRILEDSEDTKAAPAAAPAPATVPAVVAAAYETAPANRMVQKPNGRQKDHYRR